MAVDMFLKIDGIEGESTDSEHAGEIEIQSFSWGESNPTSFGSATGGGGVGKVSMQDISIMKVADKSSPFLFLACANGNHHKDAVLTFRKAGEQQHNFMVITLTDVVVSSFQLSGSSGGDIPMESVGLAYGKIEVDYLAQDAQGETKSAGKKHWDLKTNKGG